MDFSNYKFRSSGLTNLLVDSRSKTETLSETTKTYLRELWIKEVYGREKFITNKYMEKGTMVESDSLALVEKALGQTYFKNSKKLENEFVCGTPDVIEKDFVLDIKSSWDIWTFASVTEESAKKIYYAQMLGYMWLTNKTNAKLIYCLTNTPEIQINSELYHMTMKGLIEETQEAQDKAKLNYTFDDIPVKNRIKVYDFIFEDEIKAKLIERIQQARLYMNTLSL